MRFIKDVSVFAAIVLVAYSAHIYLAIDGMLCFVIISVLYSTIVEIKRHKTQERLGNKIS
jgi:hypothetical protein